ncbi:unnamed protein product [Mytilus coruscus]|uniref:Uncharacterized protein n=1 Tax=Mytilus coruscus TaxID=42192 RepID=A0A6J8DWY3_MYTCO|nr:unnamed protein product [Mytilus coruscus]
MTKIPKCYSVREFKLNIDVFDQNGTVVKPKLDIFTNSQRGEVDRSKNNRSPKHLENQQDSNSKSNNNDRSRNYNGRDRGHYSRGRSQHFDRSQNFGTNTRGGRYKLSCGFWNVNGRNTNIHSDKFNFLDSCFKYYNLHMGGIAETHLTGNKGIEVDGYNWFGFNHKNIHVRAKTGSGGIGLLIRNDICSQFDVEIIDNDTDGIFSGIETNNITQNVRKTTKYNTRNLPDDWLPTSSVISEINEIIRRLESSEATQDNIDRVYEYFVSVIKNEMSSKLPSKTICIHDGASNKKRKCRKPWWNDDLTVLWNEVCNSEKMWLKCKNRNQKKEFRNYFINKRKII